MDLFVKCHLILLIDITLHYVTVQNEVNDVCSTELVPVRPTATSPQCLVTDSSESTACEQPRLPVKICLLFTGTWLLQNGWHVCQTSAALICLSSLSNFTQQVPSAFRLWNSYIMTEYLQLVEILEISSNVRFLLEILAICWYLIDVPVNFLANKRQQMSVTCDCHIYCVNRITVLSGVSDLAQ